MPRTPEFTEVVPGTPQQLFGAMEHQHEWAPKVIPHIFPKASRHEGEGKAGSVYHYDIHEDNHGAHGGAPKMKVVMEEYNESTLSFVIDYQGDPRYSHLKFHIRFLPGPSPGTATVKWLIDYAPLTDDTPPPDDYVALNIPLATFKDLAAYLESAKLSEKKQ